MLNNRKRKRKKKKEENYKYTEPLLSIEGSGI